MMKMKPASENFSKTEPALELGAYSKVILFGEHSAVFGHPALAMGLPGGIRVRNLEPLEKGIHLVVQPWGLEATDRSSHQVGRALDMLSQLVPGELLGMDVRLQSSVPPGAGLGSSAALSVALVKCLASVRGVVLTDDRVRYLAHLLEKIFHGNPSGLDDTVATHGGMCLFVRDGVNDKEYPGTTRLSDQCLQLPLSISGLVLGDTGVKRSTSAMVALVDRQRQLDQARVDGLFSQVDSCLYEGLDAMSRGDWPGLGEAMISNHELLCQLGLSCPEIQDMTDLAMQAGALGVKLTGAGGGGAVVALAPGAEQQVASAWRQAGYFAFSAVSAKGSEA